MKQEALILFPGQGRDSEEPAFSGGRESTAAVADSDTAIGDRLPGVEVSDSIGEEKARVEAAQRAARIRVHRENIWRVLKEA